MTSGVRQARGGWWHDYVCPVHHCELGDALVTGDAVEQYPCPHGCRLQGEPFRSAWTVLHHQATARRLRLRARQYRRDGAPEHLEEALCLLRGCADLYTDLAPGRHDGAQEWMLAGRLFHQALTEAIWTAPVADAVLELAAALPLEQHDLLAPATPLMGALHDAALTARTALVERGDLRSNYVAWLDAAGALTAQALDALGTEPAAPVDWVEGPAGLVAHARAAVLNDGWEWEASTYYHVFVLRAYLLALRGHAPDDVPAELATAMRAMVGVVTDLAMPDGALPALHDSPYAREAMWAEFAEAFHLARQMFDVPALDRLVAHNLTRLKTDDGMVDLLDEWFAGPALPGPADRGATSVVHEDAGYAVLRTGGLNAVVDFGPHGGAHGHLDKLALYLFGPSSPWQPDPGITPYGSAMRHGHYSRTAAHPTFSVGGDQRECTGALLRWRDTDDEVQLVAAADTAYPGVRARRHLTAAAGYLVDVLVVTGADAPVTLALRPDVQTTSRWHAPGVVVTTWVGDQTLRGWHLLPVGYTVAARPGPGPADDPQRSRHHIDLTSPAPDDGAGLAEAVFVTVWQAEDAADARPRISGIHHDRGTVRIAFSDGTSRAHVVETDLDDGEERAR